MDLAQNSFESFKMSYLRWKIISDDTASLKLDVYEPSLQDFKVLQTHFAGGNPLTTDQQGSLNQYFARLAQIEQSLGQQTEVLNLATQALNAKLQDLNLPVNDFVKLETVEDVYCLRYILLFGETNAEIFCGVPHTLPQDKAITIAAAFPVIFRHAFHDHQVTGFNPTPLYRLGRVYDGHGQVHRTVDLASPTQQLQCGFLPHV